MIPFSFFDIQISVGIHKPLYAVSLAIYTHIFHYFIFVFILLYSYFCVLIHISFRGKSFCGKWGSVWSSSCYKHKPIALRSKSCYIYTTIYSLFYFHHVIFIILYSYFCMLIHISFRGKSFCGNDEQAFDLHRVIFHIHIAPRDTEWRRPIGCLKLQVIFRKRAPNYRALLQEMTYSYTYRSTRYWVAKTHRMP